MSADNYLAVRLAKTSSRTPTEWVVMNGNASTGNESIRTIHKTRDEAIDAANDALHSDMIEYGLIEIERRED